MTGWSLRSLFNRRSAAPNPWTSGGSPLTRSPAAFAPQAALARTFTPRFVRAVGLLALRGRHRRVVRRLRGITQLGLKLGNPCRQCEDLRCEHLNLRPQRADQRVLLVMRQAGEVGKLGHPKLESWPPWSRQPPCDSAGYTPSTGGDEQIPILRDSRAAADDSIAEAGLQASATTTLLRRFAGHRT